MAINVSIVEDDEGIRDSWTILLNGNTGMRCISTHSSAEEALEEIPKLKPNVVLMDINLPKMTGIECVKVLKEKCPEVQILMLTMYEDSDQIFESLTAGASGYLLKRDTPAKVLEAIDDVTKGGSPMSPKIARVVVQYFQKKQPSANSAVEVLSKRELQILDLLAQGFRYKEIADQLSISFDTVRSHLRNIYEKLHVTSRTEAVVKYLGGQ